ncbi:MAG: hypothetical protein N2689_02890 [Verrucomicrobiae bacterium]|nr:hypothetical protein [Verrucomicrobiae bacterium]
MFLLAAFLISNLLFLDVGSPSEPDAGTGSVQVVWLAVELLCLAAAWRWEFTGGCGLLAVALIQASRSSGGTAFLHLAAVITAFLFGLSKLLSDICDADERGFEPRPLANHARPGKRTGPASSPSLRPASRSSATLPRLGDRRPQPGMLLWLKRWFK